VIHTTALADGQTTAAAVETPVPAAGNAMTARAATPAPPGPLPRTGIMAGSLATAGLGLTARRLARRQNQT
jgi:hypothetical protein